MKFALYNDTGKIVATGYCPDGLEELQVRPGTFLYLGDVGPYDSIDVSTKERIEGAPPEPTYTELRKYPPLSEQLDALWHAMDSGEIPKATEFYNAIKAVKDEFPAP